MVTLLVLVQKGYPVLYLAAKEGHLGVVKRLLDAWADVNQPEFQVIEIPTLDLHQF